MDEIISEHEGEIEDAVEETEEETEAAPEEAETDEDLEEADSPEDDEEGDEEEDEPEEVEINFGGSKLKLTKGEAPDKVIEATQEFVKNIEAAHTRRSQGLAEQVRSLESQQKAFETMTTLQGDALNAFSRGQSAKAALESIDPNEIDRMWNSQDPDERDQARRMSDRRAALEREFNASLAQVQQYERGISEQAQVETSRQMSEGRAVADRIIKDFSTKHAPEVEKYVVDNYGMTAEQAAQWPLNPATAVMAYKAMQFDEMQKKARSKPPPKKAIGDETPVKPMKQRGSAKRRYDLNKDAAKLSADEWMKRRNAELAKRRGA